MASGRPSPSPSPAAQPFGRPSLPPSPTPAWTLPPAASPTPAPAGLLAAYFCATWGLVRADNETAARAGAQNPDRILARLLGEATTAVDAAIYELDEPGLVGALVAARRRGVAVRLVTDTDSYQDRTDPARVAAAFQVLLDEGASIVPDGRSAYMHDKFAVIDEHRVWTGSFNWTVKGAFEQNNNAVAIESRDLAANFTAEFVEMHRDGQFGKNSPADMPHPVVPLGGARVETLFGPEGPLLDTVVAEFGKARSSVKFMLFSLTSDPVGQALLDAASAGVRVEGVFDRTQAGQAASEYTRLRDAGLDVRRDGNPGFMHHKVCLVDDRTVLTGSVNYSANGFEDNDENLVIVRDSPDLAAAFLAEYGRVRQISSP